MSEPSGRVTGGACGWENGRCDRGGSDLFLRGPRYPGPCLGIIIIIIGAARKPHGPRHRSQEKKKIIVCFFGKISAYFCFVVFGKFSTNYHISAPKIIVDFEN